MRYKLFVYGTLKRGFCNHRYLEGCQFVAPVSTKKRYPLVAPKKWYPYLIDAPGEGEQIEGELYETDYKTLRRIDRLEEYPRYYGRKYIEVVDKEGKCYKALCYVLPKNRIPYQKMRYLTSFKKPK